MVYLFLFHYSFKHELGSKPSFAINYHEQDGLQPARHLLVLDTGEMREFSRGSYVYESPGRALNKKMSMEFYSFLVFLTR